MDPVEVKIWLKARSAVTRRFIKFGMFSFVAAILVAVAQFYVWAAAGWGTANLLPPWLLILIYLFAALVGLSVFYYSVALSARFRGTIQWGMSVCMGTLAMGSVVMALAHSVPQMSTLMVSAPTEIALRIHGGRLEVSSSGRSGKRICRTNIRFGPLYAFRGGWCGVYMSPGQTYDFQGHGNAIAVRLHSFEK